MVVPAYLKKEDKVAIIAPAAKISADYVDRATNLLNDWGLEVITGKNILKGYNYFSATDTQRAHDLQKALDDSSVKAIICARGGYGTIRIIDKLDLTAFKKNPKWIVGFSDITVLHNFIQQFANTETIHGAMPVQFENTDAGTLESLRKALFGEKIDYSFKTNKRSIPGKSSAVLAGGNLSVLQSLRGTPWDLDTYNKILFIEDIDEYLYHIDRMMQNLKAGGKLANIKGVIIGRMNKMKDGETGFGRNVEEIILDALGNKNIPVAFDFPGGHDKQNHAFYLGREVTLSVSNDFTVVKF